MTLYLFHLRNGSELVQDVEGQDLPDLDAAKRFALLCARDVLSDEMRNGYLNLGLRLDVVDATGAVVHSILSGEAFTVMGRLTPSPHSASPPPARGL